MQVTGFAAPLPVFRVLPVFQALACLFGVHCYAAPGADFIARALKTDAAKARAHGRRPGLATAENGRAFLTPERLFAPRSGFGLIGCRDRVEQAQLAGLP